jgi:hypothetical protein
MRQEPENPAEQEARAAWEHATRRLAALEALLRDAMEMRRYGGPVPLDLMEQVQEMRETCALLEAALAKRP